MKLDILLLIVKIEEEQNHSLKNGTRDKIIRSVINGRITYTEGRVQNSTLNFDSLIYFHNYNVFLQKLQWRIPKCHNSLNISIIVLHIRFVLSCIWDPKNLPALWLKPNVFAKPKVDLTEKILSNCYLHRNYVR